MGYSHPKSIKIVPGIQLDSGMSATSRSPGMKGGTIRIPSPSGQSTASAESAPASHTKKRSPKATAKIFGFALVMLSLIAVGGLFYKNNAVPSENALPQPKAEAPSMPLPEEVAEPEPAEPEPVATLAKAAPAELVIAEPPPVPFTLNTPLPARIVLEKPVVVISQVIGGVGIGKGQTVDVIRRSGYYLVVQKDEAIFAVEAASVVGYMAP